jgi:hypothetical protein
MTSVSQYRYRSNICNCPLQSRFTARRFYYPIPGTIATDCVFLEAAFPILQPASSHNEGFNVSFFDELIVAYQAFCARHFNLSVREPKIYM